VRIRLADGSSRYYYAKALTKERFKESWNKPSRQKLIQAGHPQAPLAVFDSHIMLLHPAHDRGIGHLKWLIDQAERRHLFKACSLPPLQDYEELEIDILRYKPERRLVARISKDRQPLAVIRCANPDEFTKMLMGNAFGVAQGGVHLLGADGANRTLATSWQKGRSLCPEEGEPPTVDLVRQLARQVTRIHHAGYKHPIRYTIEDEAKSLKGVINTFKHILPEQTEWFVSLVERVEKGLASVPEHFALIHGDFSLDQVIRRENKLGETRLHILDWDRSAYGNPLMDLATFQARLELQVIEGILPRRRADARREVASLDQRAMTLAGELADAQRRLRESDKPTYAGLGSRIEQLLRSAEEQSASVLSKANAEADALLTRTRTNAKNLSERSASEAATPPADARLRQTDGLCCLHQLYQPSAY